MADFLPRTNFDPNAPNWLGASKAPEKRDYQSSSTLETLFSGIGKIGAGMVNAVDEGIKGNIKEDVYAGVDAIRGAQGVDDAAAGSPVPTVSNGAVTGTQPPEVGRYGERAAKLTAAMKDGRISDTYYHSQLEALTRQVRAKYPGYREQIDEMVRNTTGITPANALRNSLLAELTANRSEADKAAKDEKKWVEDRVGYMTPSMRQRLAANGQLPTKAELLPVVAQTDAEEMGTKAAKSRLELNAAQGKLVAEDALATATGEINTRTARVFDQVLDGIGGSESVLGRVLKEGKGPSGPELQQIKSQFVVMKAEYQKMVDGVMTTPIGASGKSYEQLMGDPTKAKQVREAAMERINRIEQLITDGNFGAAAMHANALKASRDQNTRQLYDRSDWHRNMDTVMSLPGAKEIVPLLIQSPGGAGILSEGLRRTEEVFRVKTAAGTGNVTEHLGELKRAGAGPAAYKEAVNGYVNMLSDPRVSPEIRANAAKAIFSDPNLITNFKEKTEVFTRLVSPDTTKRMLELKDKDPATWEAYSRWSKNTFSQVFRQLGQDVSSATGFKWLDVKYDEGSKQYVIAPSAEGLSSISKFPDAKGDDPLRAMMRKDSSISRLVQNVDQLNKSMRSIEPIFKAEGHDVGKEMGGLLKAMGVDPAAPKDKGFLEKLWDATKNGAKALQATDAVSDGVAQSFGGQTLNFRQASGGNTGTGSQVSLNGSTIKTGSADTENLNPKMKGLLQSLADEGIVEVLGVNSGYRDPARNARAGGAKASTHMDGAAIDIDVSGMSDEQKTAVLEAAIAKGAKGIGVYPSGNSLHIDTRDTPATWGYSPFGKYKGVDWSQQPAWAHGPLKKLFGEKVSAVDPADLPAEGSQDAMFVPDLQSRNVREAGRWNRKAITAINERFGDQAEVAENFLATIPVLKEAVEGTSPKDTNIEALFTATEEFLREATPVDYVRLQEAFALMDRQKKDARTGTNTPDTVGFRSKGFKDQGTTPKELREYIGVMKELLTKD